LIKNKRKNEEIYNIQYQYTKYKITVNLLDIRITYSETLATIIRNEP